MSKWNLIINVGRCENCNNCVIAERDEHVGNDFRLCGAGRRRRRPIRILRRAGHAPMVEATYLPVMCNHCDDALHRRAGDAIRKRDDGIVIIDPEGQGPQGHRRLLPLWGDRLERGAAGAADLDLRCAPARSGWSRPRCQQSCLTDVFEAVKLDDAVMRKRRRRKGSRCCCPAATKPRVWYRGLERWETCFVGGSVSAEVAGVVGRASRGPR